MKRFAFAVLPIGFAVTVACSSSSSSSSVSADQACADYAAGACSAVDKCGATLLQLLYGDVATCTARLKLKCAPALVAPGTALTPAITETCSQSLGSISCNDIFARNLPTECQAKAGTIANGGACGVDDQCVSTFCQIAPGSVCGTCATGRATAGGACKRDEDCNYGLKCAGNSLCVAPGSAGGTCDANHPCSPTLACKGGTCATRAASGATCDPVAQDCDTLSGLFCNTMTKVCQAITFANAGAACGFTNGAYTACSANGTCKLAMGMTTGTCQGTAADGAMCDEINGPVCMDGATCVSGVCKLSDPSSCK